MLTVNEMKSIRHERNRKLLKNICHAPQGLSPCELYEDFLDESTNTLHYRLRLLKNSGMIYKEGSKYFPTDRVDERFLSLDDNTAWAFSSVTARKILKKLYEEDSGIKGIIDFVQKDEKPSTAEILRCLRELRLRGIVIKKERNAKSEIMKLGLNDKHRNFIKEAGCDGL